MIEVNPDTACMLYLAIALVLVIGFWLFQRKKNKKEALVSIELETGRYHQIRVQMSAIGSPVVGDSKYGGKGGEKKSCICLQHFCFEIPHPITKEILTFTLPPAFDL